MKKLVSIVGSPRGGNSQTNALIKKVIEQIENNNIDISSKIFNISELNIHKCKGCSQCFFHCSSCINFTDNIIEIEQALLESDFIIFGSPVYAHNITGEMKNFIDRISHFIHIMALSGKYGLVISTSSSNGNIYVNRYLTKIMECMGIKVVDSISYMSLLEFNKENFFHTIDTISKILNDEINLKPSTYQEKNFTILKNAYSKIYENSILSNSKLKNQEALYWVNNGYLKFDSFEDFFIFSKNI